MSPPRRRSARLASTPKVSLCFSLFFLAVFGRDRSKEPTLTNGKQPTKLSSSLGAVQEQNELPTPIAARALPPIPASPVVALRHTTCRIPTTPPSSALKPPHNGMHPSKVHQSTGEPSSALRLGFTDIKPETERSSFGPVGQNTPSRTSSMATSTFSFDFSKSIGSGQFSSDAQRIMEELQEKAARIKADLVAQREANTSDISGRRFAKPKGRFSAAHSAEFDKMDSIENHASAWRANRFTPVVAVAGVKRSPSKANLDTTPSKPSLARSPSKTSLNQPFDNPRRDLKRKSSAANLDGRSASSASPKKERQEDAVAKPQAVPVPIQGLSSAKRMKKLRGDDASASRPDRLGGSSSKPLPKAPSSTISRLLSPTKASRAHFGSPGKSIASASTPSKSLYGQLGRPTGAAIPTLVSPFKSLDSTKQRNVSPGRLQKVKSILRGFSNNEVVERSCTIPQPSVSQTPGPRRTDKELPPLPLTTPRRLLTKRVTFTPDTKRAAVEAQNSPSPLRRSIMKFGSPSKGLNTNRGPETDPKEVASGKIEYPDLSAYSHLLNSSDKKDDEATTPGTFTFRSAHTIEFKDTSRKGFGMSPGKPSIRQVRESMPGTFPGPSAPSTHPDKENKAPSSPVKLLSGVPHGLSTKKRNRPSTDEEDAANEAVERAVKKQKSMHVPDGQKLLAARTVGTPAGSAKKIRLDRLANSTPRRTLAATARGTPASASPTKKRVGMSISRLNMLARPKNRV